MKFPRELGDSGIVSDSISLSTRTLNKSREGIINNASSIGNFQYITAPLEIFLKYTDIFYLCTLSVVLEKTLFTKGREYIIHSLIHPEWIRSNIIR